MNELITKTDNLSWYSIEFIVNKAANIASRKEDKYIIEYKHIRYILFCEHGILLEEKPGTAPNAEDVKRPVEEENTKKFQHPEGTQSDNDGFSKKIFGAGLATGAALAAAAYKIHNMLNGKNNSSGTNS